MTGTLVLDTNVLEYLFDDDTHNADGHIDRLLRTFAQKQKKLGLDRPTGGQSSRILGEYKNRLQFHVRQMNAHGLRAQWIRYVLEFAVREDVPVNLKDGLGNCIVSAIGHQSRVHAETSDQVFVYVGIRLDCVLVSDDDGHITDHETKLRKCAKAQGSDNSDFLSSAQAAADI